MTVGSWDISADAALPRLVDLHGARLFHLGRRLCGNESEAEDLVQETFLAAFRGWAGFEGRADPVTWLYTIAARACQRMHRKRSGEPDELEPLDELLPFGRPALGVAPASPLEEAMRSEGRAAVERAILELPLSFRMPLMLKDILGFAVRDIAEMLGLAENTVKTRVHRARLRLRKALDERLPQEPIPPAEYSRQVCLDLLAAKQESLDRAVPAPELDGLICRRCNVLFETMDLTQSLCADLARGELPAEVRERLLASLRDA